MLLLGLLISTIGLVDASKPPAVFGLDIQRQAVNPDEFTDWRARPRRRGTVQLTFNGDPRFTGYYANVSFGTPPQPVSLRIDITAGDTWVNVANSSYCTQYSTDCALYGTYNINASSTYTYVNNDFAFVFDGMRYVSGSFVTDTIQIQSQVYNSGLH